MTGLRWGILATGFIARLFTEDLRASGIEVVAVGSRSQESADAFAARFKIPRAYGSYEELVADAEVDIVYVATPHPQHAENALAALAAGKHVLVEKPFTLNRAEAERVQAFAAERGLLVMEAMWTRYLPHIVRMRELLVGGAIGEIRAVTAAHMQLLPTDPAHRLNDLALGGGALLDLGIYPVSFVWDVLGAPTSVHAVGRLSETGADTEVATVMTHAGGVVSTTLSSSRAAGASTATVVGTEGRIEIDHFWLAPSTLRLVGPDGTVREEFDGRPASDEGRGMQFEAYAAERLVREGLIDGEVLPIAETVAIMGCLDEIRGQIGVRYPDETDR